MVELSQLAEHCSRLVSVLGHSTRQGFGCGRTDSFLMVGDITNQQGAELGDQFQTQRLPESEEEGQAMKIISTFELHVSILLDNAKI